MSMWIQNPGTPGSQIYGHMPDMEIHFELEDSDIDVEFKPDFRMPGNYSDTTKVQWELSDSPDKDSLDGVLIQFPSEEPLYESSVSVENLRLLYRHDKGGTDT